MMVLAADPVEHGIPQVDVRGRHVDPRPQHVGAILELPVPHPREHVEVLLDRP